MVDKYLSHKLKVVSFLSIILVISTHSYNLSVRFKGNYESIEWGYDTFIQDFLSHGISRIAVPLFFMMSGYLFFFNIKKGLLSEFIVKYKKRLRTLVLPYLLWSVYGLLFFFLLQSIPQSEPFFTNQLIKDYSGADLLTTIFLQPIPYQLWFIRDIIVLVFFSPILYFSIRYLKFYFIGLLLITWGLKFNFVIFSEEALFFFALGGFLSIFRIDLQNFKFRNQYLLCTFVWLLAAFSEKLLRYTSSQDYYLFTVLHKVSILFGIAAIWFLYDQLFINKDISKSRFFKITHYTFFIYAFHEPVLTIIKKTMYFILGVSRLNSMLIYFIAPFVTIAIAVLISYYWKKISLESYKLVTGGR